MAQKTFEQKWQMLTPEFQSKFQELKNKEWDEAIYLAVDLSDKIDRFRVFALMFENEKTMGVYDGKIVIPIKSDYFKWLSLSKTIDQYNLHDLNQLCKVMENRVMFNWKQIYGNANDDEFVDFFDCRVKIREILDIVIESIDNKLMNKVASMQHISNPNLPQVPWSGAKNIIMS